MRKESNLFFLTALLILASYLLAILLVNDTGQIAIHFNLAGIPDHWGSKNELYQLGLVNGLLLIAFFFLAKHPQKLNYPVAVTAENRERLYQKMQHCWALWH